MLPCVDTLLSHVSLKLKHFSFSPAETQLPICENDLSDHFIFLSLKHNQGLRDLPTAVENNRAQNRPHFGYYAYNVSIGYHVFFPSNWNVILNYVIQYFTVVFYRVKS